MAATFPLSILTPEKVFYRGDARELTAYTGAGKIGILARHTPLLTTLQPGKITVRGAGSEADQQFETSGGMLEVRRDGQVVVLADTIGESVQ